MGCDIRAAVATVTDDLKAAFMDTSWIQPVVDAARRLGDVRRYREG
jgi:hypothetical protein